MASYFGITSDSVSTLFSSMRTNKNNTSNIQLNTQLFSEYASLKNGSYYKLSKAYYQKQDNPVNISNAEQDKDSQISLRNTKDVADELKESTQDFLTKGTASVFAKEKIKDEDGTETYGINSSKVQKKLESFIRDYNQIIDAAKNSKTTGILTPAASLTAMTTNAKQLLLDVGITVSTDNKLKLDQKLFDKAEMTQIKSLFQGAGSYGYQIQSKAFSIGSAAQNELEKTATYSEKGRQNYLNKPQFETVL